MWLSDELLLNFSREYMPPTGARYKAELFQSGSVVIDFIPICNVFDLPIIINQLKSIQAAFENVSGIKLDAS